MLCEFTRTPPHSYSYTWSKNDTGHWYECSVCHVKKDEAGHDYDNACDISCNTCGYTRVTTHRYDNACDTSCNVCGTTRTITHSYKTSWSKSKNKHWNECSICGYVKDEASHVPGAPATETTDQTCTVCSYVIKAALGHTHAYNGEWIKDTENHWKECDCGEKSSVSAHTWNEGEITHEPSVELEGEKTFTCTVCFATKTEAIDKLDPPADEPNEPEIPEDPEDPSDPETPEEPDTPNEPETPEEPDNSETPSDDKQESGNKDEENVPTSTTDNANETITALEKKIEKQNTVIIIIAAVASVAVLACCGVTTALIVVLKKKK